MLPTMGQGANSSIEDGACICRLIGEPVAAGADLDTALAAYDHTRRARCQRIAADPRWPTVSVQTWEEVGRKSPATR